MFSSDVFWSLLVLLTTSWLTTQAAEPNCTHVADFDNCLGNADNFCPKGVACGCKDQMPFCKCPSYRSQWEDYWYMGPKCESLWSTADLIVVATLPALALAAIAAVTVQCIGSCKNKPKKRVKHSSPSARQPRPPGPLNSSHNPYLANKDDGAQETIFPRLTLQSQFQGSSFEQVNPEHVGGFSALHPPLRRLIPKETGPLTNWSSGGNQNGPWEPEMPNNVYEENPFSDIPMRQFNTPDASVFPQPDYHQHAPNYLNAQRGSRPYGIGRAQNIRT